MRAARVWAIAALAVLGGYHLMRFAAAQCVGAQCEWYIPLSLLLPLATWVQAVVAGMLGAIDARRERHTRWFAILAAGAVLTLVAPIVTLLVFRDSPDQFVAIATVWIAL